MSTILRSLTQGLTIADYPDWLIFVQRLNDAVSTGRLRRIPVLKQVWSEDEEWILDPESDEVYLYGPPDPPALPKWEKLDMLERLEAADPAPLSTFPIGQMSVMTAHIMKMRLAALVSRGLAEELPIPVEVPQSKDRTEKWYKDMVSNVVYRLSEHYGLQDSDDLRWEVVPPEFLHHRIQ